MGGRGEEAILSVDRYQGRSAFEGRPKWEVKEFQTVERLGKTYRGELDLFPEQERED